VGGASAPRFLRVIKEPWPGVSDQIGAACAARRPLLRFVNQLLNYRILFDVMLHVFKLLRRSDSRVVVAILPFYMVARKQIEVFAPIKLIVECMNRGSVQGSISANSACQ
jgi:hypothetical protein